MDNPIIALIHRHTSVRHYQPDPFPITMVETIISAAAMRLHLIQPPGL